MKRFVPILYLVSVVLAEPPVRNGYPAARSSSDQSYDDHEDHRSHQPSEHQRSLSQAYGVPSSASYRNTLSTEYGVPNTRMPHNHARGQSQNHHARPVARVSFNQRFRSSSAKNSGQGHTGPATRSHSHEYQTPANQGEISKEYGIPSARQLSQKYGVPSIVSARTLSTEYGMPDVRSTPSQEYGVPEVAARSGKSHSTVTNFHSSESLKSSPQEHFTQAATSQFQTESQSNGFSASPARSNDETQDYSVPSAESQDNSLNHSDTDFLSRSNDSQDYETSKLETESDIASQNPYQSHKDSKHRSSTAYDTPASRSSSSYEEPSSKNFNTQRYESVSDTYNAPNQRDVSATYSAPNARMLSAEYGAPSSRNNLNSDAVSSSDIPASSRSTPSATYLPSARDAMPLQKYGVPEHDSSQGYDYSRARALDELLNQEPASYDFAYQIEDQESGSDFGHMETREANRAEGSYFVVLPDGTKHTVEYEADERGFKPRITVEAADASARSGSGYDENAAEVAAARSADGPY